MLLSVNHELRPEAKCPQATAAPGEFKKPVYESKFRKRAK